jgi:hypothetical protein
MARAGNAAATRERLPLSEQAGFRVCPDPSPLPTPTTTAALSAVSRLIDLPAQILKVTWVDDRA